LQIDASEFMANSTISPFPRHSIHRIVLSTIPLSARSVEYPSVWTFLFASIAYIRGASFDIMMSNEGWVGNFIPLPREEALLDPSQLEIKEEILCKISVVACIRSNDVKRRQLRMNIGITKK